MELKPGLSALITGGASGIGKALCLALADSGVFITVVDYSVEEGKKVTALIEKQLAKFHKNLKFPSATFIKCDVTNTGELSSAFAKHLATYGGLDICVNSAGIVTPVPLHKDQTDGSGTWKHAINVNLIAVIQCTLLAIKAMQASKRTGVVINMGSSAGLYPLVGDPVYSAAKGGVALFTRALRPYKHQGIRVNVLCPEFVETEIGFHVEAKFLSLLGGFIPMDLVVKGAIELITDETKAGSCLWITNRRGLEYWPTPEEEAKYRVSSSKLKSRSMLNYPLELKLPQSFEKIVVHTLNHNFRAATRIQRTPLGLPIKQHHVLVKILYAGVNASDVNFSSGRYFSGNSRDLAGKLPFDAGFEAVGIIAAVGDSVGALKIGTAAAVMTFGSYAEFMIVPSKFILPVASPDPEVVAMLTSGLTASIALEKAAQMGSGKTVLVTAAAGGTGQFAVQLAKLAGNKVIATCGGSDKAMLLKKLGVDRVINYKEEDVKTVLKKEFPKGIDIIYESVGGEMFDMCLNALAIYGRLVVIGMISQYQGEHGWKPSNYPGLCEKLLAKSQTVAGFFLVQYSRLWQQHLDKLFSLYSSGKLEVNMDPRRFVGLQSVADAVEYLHSGKSIGKVVVCIDRTFSQAISKM
ncbi:prostaglandin reductase-3-like [Chenopodium quinoa]|uniref:prostaglandin reductase-3-like n=1 Tax=Chenopodium quinoa TaxID=63459 RepID=UPI000B780E56|nr:prostaglandin reductase-3-like [Chenopodium quinoa]